MVLVFHWLIASCQSKLCRFSGTKTFYHAAFALFLFPLSWWNLWYFCQNYNLTRRNRGSEKSFSEGFEYPLWKFAAVLFTGQMVPSLCCGSLGLWLYLIKRLNKKCLKAKMINYHCFKIKLNHYLSAGPPLSIVPDDDISFPFRRNIPEIHNITNQLNDFSAKNKVLISDLVTKFWIKNRHDSVLN